MKNHEQVAEIASRIAYMRDTLDMSCQFLADKLGMTCQKYMEYESGNVDFPVSMIYSLAAILGVDATELLTGEAPKMRDYTVTRKGHGVSVDRHEGYSFESLAANFIGRDKEPMIVTLSPEKEKAALITHSGQEFNYVLSGKIGLILGDKTIMLEEGDSVYFKPSMPHGQFAVDGEAKFLTVIDKE